VLSLEEGVEMVDHVHANISDQVLVDIDRFLRSVKLVVLLHIWQWDVVLENLAYLMYLNFVQFLL
jgi:hypothetical protein